MRIYAARKVERHLSSDELTHMAEALHGEHAAGTNPVIVAAPWVLMLSGRRRGEVLGLRWDEVDAERFALRPKDIKAGPAIVPLTQAVYAVPRTGSRFVFPSIRSATGHLRDIGHVWDRVRAGDHGINAEEKNPSTGDRDEHVAGRGRTV